MTTPDHDKSRRLFPAPLEYAALAGVVFLTAYASIVFGTTAGRISAIWPVNAIVVAWGFRSASPRLYLLAAGYAGNLCANLAAGDHSILAILLPLANTAEILICLMLIDRPDHRLEMARPSHLAQFGFVTAPLAAAASAGLAFVIFWIGGAPPELAALGRWFLADLLGLMVIAPALMALMVDDLRAGLTLERLARGGYALVLLLGALWAIFSQSSMPILFLAPPVLVLAAFELGFAGAAIGILLTTVASMLSLLLESGPITLFQADLAQQVLLMQFFLATCIFSSMPVAAILEQRKRLMLGIQADGEKISASEARYRHLWETSSDIILRIDPDGIVRYALPSIQSIGYTPGEMVNRPALDFVSPETRDSSAVILADSRCPDGPDPTLKREHKILTRWGGHVWWEGNPSQVRDAQGNLIEIVTVMRDISARRAAEASLAVAKEHAEAAAEAKATFLSNMSHELRTPLTSIIGFAGLLSVRQTLADEDRRMIGIVKSAGETLLRVVNDILDYSKLDAGADGLELSDVSLTTVLNECVDLVRVQATAKGLDLTLEAVDDATVVADSSKLRQILLNLLGNAIKFTEHGGVTLTAQVTTCSGDADVMIAISDTGIGIPPDKLTTIFERFSQADGSVSRRFGGTGLGLSISQSLAKLMGGSITAQSDGAAGSVFTLHLRLKLGGSDELSATPSGAAVAGPT